MVSRTDICKRNISELIGLRPRAITAEFVRAWFVTAEADQMVLAEFDYLDARTHHFWQFAECRFREFHNVRLPSYSYQKLREATYTQRALLNELQEKIDIVSRPRRWSELAPETKVGDIFDQRFRRVMKVTAKRIDDSCPNQTLIWFTCQTIEGDIKIFPIEA